MRCLVRVRRRLEGSRPVDSMKHLKKIGLSTLALGMTFLALAAADPTQSPPSAPPPTGQMSAGQVDARRMQADEPTGNNWLMYGRTYSEQRFSPLSEIND